MLKLISPLADSSVINEGLHVFSLAKEKLSSMAETILYGNWIQFNVLLHEVKELKLSQKCLDKFGQDQVMKIAIARDFTFPELDALREKLILAGVSEEAASEVYQGLSKIERPGSATKNTAVPALRRMLISGSYKKRSGEPMPKLV
ncbi:hypothetical protein A3B84_01450 [Candidatus Nomurabacteria bacterium RIFCSPHIGHO2_02_FULL_35_13]|uniref:Uncharacterized protein n=1 Tax=Candidatus Nomurabacteria bacterium RIFCSPHIGHO2_02_FULL_35_13 TaxID=1801748 RepID=A0A1F6VNQ3_9BACT|nr:MAG: hypothetical protein A3B84_01450 [Candidatus Nomurabacteria bacterium RIFCSPHIGHO2_02_FULL_35_13]